MSASDYVGVATLITATAAALVSIIVAIKQVNVHAHVDAIDTAVRTSDGRTIGEMVETNEARNIAADATPPPAP
jgi:hypothetical protein